MLDASTGLFELYISSDTFSNVGTLKTNLMLIDRVEETHSKWFDINVVEGIDNTVIESSNEFTALTTTLGKVVNIDSKISDKADKADKSITEQSLLSLNQQLAETNKKLKEAELENLVKEQKISFKFGGQLNRLKMALINPLHQFLGIAFGGDSITWGLGASGTNPAMNTGRDGTLSDVRNFSTSPSFFNLLAKYIGEQYMLDFQPTFSNWEASPGGESTTTYERESVLFPNVQPFTTNVTSHMSKETVSDASSLLGFFLKFRNTQGYAGEGGVSFDFTGEEFEVIYNSLPNTMDYEAFVDGVSKDVYQTRGTGSYNNRRKHTFDFVKNKKIEIKALNFGEGSAAQELRLCGIPITFVAAGFIDGAMASGLYDAISNLIGGNK